jgi:glycolate oxidase FAD binding subunit
VTGDAVLDDLGKAAATRPAAGSDAVDGVPARYVVAPVSTDEVAEVLRAAARHELSVVPRGAGTKLGWGVPPSSADVLLDTGGLAGVVEHAAGDLVVVVRAGTPAADLQRQVAAAGQQLALDVPYAGATVGGSIATSTSGPRRLLYGTVRDLLIGVTFVRADGVVAKAGGKVVKNVAGYDFGKLLAGSFGTLGVITEAVFRLHPLPAARRFVTAAFPDAAEAGRAALAVLGSQTSPTAVELDGSTAGVTVTVLVEGVDAGVGARTEAVRPLLGPDATVGEDPPGGFGVLPFTDGGTGVKATSSLTGVGPVLATARECGLTVRGSAAGCVYGGLPETSDPDDVATAVARLRDVASSYDGSVVVLTAPPAVRDHLDPWGPVPGLELMRRLKDELDPGHRLSPGRFVGGI